MYFIFEWCFDIQNVTINVVSDHLWSVLFQTASTEPRLDGITSIKLGFIIEHYLSQHTNRKPYFTAGSSLHLIIFLQAPPGS